MKKVIKKQRPGLLVMIKLHLALRRAKKDPPAVGEDAERLLLEAHEVEQAQGRDEPDLAGLDAELLHLFGGARME